MNEDSLKLNYVKNGDKTKHPFSIDKSNVLKYYYAEKPKEKNQGQATFSKTKYSDMTLVKGDTIYLNKEGDLEFRRTLINKNEALELMSRNPIAYKHMKKANSLYDGLIFVSVIAAPLILLPLRVTGVSIQDKLTVSAVVFIVSCAVAIPLEVAYKKRSRKAIQLFNELSR